MQLLPAATHVGVVRLQISDLHRSLAYYQQVLGLHLLARDGDVALLGTQADRRPLVELRERRGARALRQNGRLGLYHFAILLPDRAALGRFITHLASTAVRAGASDHFVSEALYLRDPDGLGIEIYADRSRDRWERRDGEIRMETSPLDLEDLAHAARGVPWTGMPPGTVMGHVHLHVGDLAGGARFFHETLGLDKMVWSYPSALFLSAGGYHHHLGINVWAGADAPRPTEDDARLIEWTLVLPTSADVDAVAARLTAAGHPVTDGRVSDPWGTTLRLTTPGDD
jgi:catechol 2,3-dioxygenase